NSVLFLLRLLPGRLEHCRHHGYCVTLNDGVVTAEAGLCVEIPCSFTSLFDPEMIISFKCDPSQGDWTTCPVAFNSSLTSKNGRVSLLESDISKKNCSIRINNLIDSDSGSYLLRVEGRGPGHKYTYTVAKTTLSLTALQQKPTLVVPPLTEGQQTTLTCTAPGLCPGSPPNITWRWRGEEEEDFNITGNITAVTQTHSSTLTFNPSAEHHGTNITCKISFTGDTTTEETVTLNVTCEYNFLLYRLLLQPEIAGATTAEEGDALTLTCTADSDTLTLNCTADTFPPSLITWTKSGTNKTLSNKTAPDSGTSDLLVHNVTAEDSGHYLCTSNYLNTSTQDVNVTVISKVELCWVFFLCGVDGFPQTFLTWTKLSSNSILNNGTGSATLFISNVTSDHAGRYICTAEHLNNTERVDVKVKCKFLQILTT
uniref:Ig-like domain-containing protein n=1 Tax=Nothobranchius furzeri TaxID=105023 RepID=A0A8C6NUA7_NOTFU